MVAAATMSNQTEGTGGGEMGALPASNANAVPGTAVDTIAGEGRLGSNADANYVANDKSSGVSAPGGPINAKPKPINSRPAGGPINARPSGGPINARPSGGPINRPSGGAINRPPGGPINRVPINRPINSRRPINSTQSRKPAAEAAGAVSPASGSVAPTSTSAPASASASGGVTNANASRSSTTTPRRLSKRASEAGLENAVPAVMLSADGKELQASSGSNDEPQRGNVNDSNGSNVNVINGSHTGPAGSGQIGSDNNHLNQTATAAEHGVNATGGMTNDMDESDKLVAEIEMINHADGISPDLQPADKSGSANNSNPNLNDALNPNTGGSSNPNSLSNPESSLPAAAIGTSAMEIEQPGIGSSIPVGVPLIPAPVTAGGKACKGPGGPLLAPIGAPGAGPAHFPLKGTPSKGLPFLVKGGTPGKAQVGKFGSGVGRPPISNAQRAAAALQKGGVPFGAKARKGLPFGKGMLPGKGIPGKGIPGKGIPGMMPGKGMIPGKGLLPGKGMNIMIPPGKGFPGKGTLLPRPPVKFDAGEYLMRIWKRAEAVKKELVSPGASAANSKSSVAPGSGNMNEGKDPESKDPAASNESNDDIQKKESEPTAATDSMEVEGKQAAAGDSVGADSKSLPEGASAASNNAAGSDKLLNGVGIIGISKAKLDDGAETKPEGGESAVADPFNVKKEGSEAQADGSGDGGVKREEAGSASSLVAPGPPPRPKPATDANGRITPNPLWLWYDQMAQAIEYMMEQTKTISLRGRPPTPIAYAYLFWFPVDLNQFPNYMDKIRSKRAVSLGEISLNLKWRKYKTPDDLDNDVKVMVSNCIEYNAGTSDRGHMCHLANILRDEFAHYIRLMKVQLERLNKMREQRLAQQQQQAAIAAQQQALRDQELEQKRQHKLRTAEGKRRLKEERQREMDIKKEGRRQQREIEKARRAAEREERRKIEEEQRRIEEERIAEEKRIEEMANAEEKARMREINKKKMDERRAKMEAKLSYLGGKAADKAKDVYKGPANPVHYYKQYEKRGGGKGKGKGGARVDPVLVGVDPSQYSPGEKGNDEGDLGSVVSSAASRGRKQQPSSTRKYMFRAREKEMSAREAVTYHGPHEPEQDVKGMSREDFNKWKEWWLGFPEDIRGELVDQLRIQLPHKFDGKDLTGVDVLSGEIDFPFYHLPPDQQKLMYQYCMFSQDELNPEYRGELVSHEEREKEKRRKKRARKRDRAERVEKEQKARGQKKDALVTNSSGLSMFSQGYGTGDGLDQDKRARGQKGSDFDSSSEDDSERAFLREQKETSKKRRTHGDDEPDLSYPGGSGAWPTQSPDFGMNRRTRRKKRTDSGSDSDFDDDALRGSGARGRRERNRNRNADQNVGNQDDESDSDDRPPAFFGAGRSVIPRGGVKPTMTLSANGLLTQNQYPEEQASSSSNAQNQNSAGYNAAGNNNLNFQLGEMSVGSLGEVNLGSLGDVNLDWDPNAENANYNSTDAGGNEPNDQYNSWGAGNEQNDQYNNYGYDDGNAGVPDGPSFDAAAIAASVGSRRMSGEFQGGGASSSGQNNATGSQRNDNYNTRTMLGDQDEMQELLDILG